VTAGALASTTGGAEANSVKIITPSTIQAHSGVAFEKAGADTLCGLPGESGQRNGRDGRVQIELEKSLIHGQDHDKTKHRDEQSADERHRPKRHTIEEAGVVD